MKLNLCVCEIKTFLFVCYEGEKKEINDKKIIMVFDCFYIFKQLLQKKYLACGLEYRIEVL